MSDYIPKHFILKIPLPTYLSFNDPLEAVVYIAVYSFTNNGKNECFASQRSIASRANCSQDSVRRMIRKLLVDGYLTETSNKQVRGGCIQKYVVSERWSFTKPTKVNDGRSLKEGNTRGDDIERYSYLKEVNDTAVEVNDTAVEVNDFNGLLQAKHIKETNKENINLTEEDFEHLLPLLTDKHIARIAADFNIMGFEVTRVWKKMLNSRIARNKPYTNWISGLRVWIQGELDDGKIIKQGGA